jgi:hypothetical protein
MSEDVLAKAACDRWAHLAWVKLFALDLAGFDKVLSESPRDRLFA